MNRERKRIKKGSKRKILYDLYDGRCCACGKKLSLKNPKAQNSYMTLDHIVPKSKGGRADIYNMQPMCKECNQNKGANFNVFWQIDRVMKGTF